MTPHDLDLSYKQKKTLFHDYIDTIKRNAPWDIYTIINPTLIKNPYASAFPKRYFTNELVNKNQYLSFISNLFFFYIKNIYFILSYAISFIMYKIYYKKERNKPINTLIDIFGLIDNINRDNHFQENYFKEAYDVFEQYKEPYTILLRLYGANKNPFKLIKFFKIINQDPREFIFEYELLRWTDFITLIKLVFLYPLKTHRLLQKQYSHNDEIFNQALLDDLRFFRFDSLTRYIVGINLTKIGTLKRIFSWSEFQVIERSFNFGIRKNNSNIKLTACQFYLNYETYFNTYVDDIDNEMLSAPHEILVNGKYYLLNRNQVQYKNGVSLRYKDIFTFDRSEKGKNILLLGSYQELDTKHMLKVLSSFGKVLFKNHPAVSIDNLGKLPNNIFLVHENIYELFKSTSIVIGTASGSAVEAVACGISVIIIASQDNLTANPLVEYGKGKIWDIAFTENDVQLLYNNLLLYRKNNIYEIFEIASWYKEKFFIEPTEENIVKAFALEKEEDI